MDGQRVREAYSSAAAQYIDLHAGGLPEGDEDVTFIGRHLVDLPGLVLDAGCGPGHWSAHLHALGVDVLGVDLVPEFIAHARAHHSGPRYQLRSMTDVDVAAGSVAGVLAWYSTIHLSPTDLDPVLAHFRRLLAPGGVLVVGLFASDDGVAAFDHKVTTAYRWPLDVFADRLAGAGLVEVDRRQQHVPERPDRIYAAVAAHAA